jgi:acyl-CoA reductase-like NAD-dependent aldehyde dehydrogenase
MNDRLRVVSPVDQSVFLERPWASEREAEYALDAAVLAQRDWREVPIAERAEILNQFVKVFLEDREAIAEELTWQMGRPIKDSPGELRGFEERARCMIDLAEAALEDVQPAPKDHFRRFIRREPLGVVFIISAWNYPYLISVNGVVPALMAGNAVILKPSAQTPLCGDRFFTAFEEAGLPKGLFTVLHADHPLTNRIVGDRRVDFVNFTGSVGGGRAVHQAAADRFIAVGLELGGKDPAYVRADADLPNAVANLVDGSFYNAGQSCCGIERIYVHRSQYLPFVEAFVAETKNYVLGNPLDPKTSLGPLVRTAAADAVRAQIDEAIAHGAKALIDPKSFPNARANTPYLAPQVLIDVNHTMAIMREETFGPAVGIMPVSDDEQAIQRMNDSRYGLSASVWTNDEEAALEIGQKVETGTFFMNRCDYLDPALAWVGVKDSGRGCTLSRVGYEVLTRPKSFHLRRK